MSIYPKIVDIIKQVENLSKSVTHPNSSIEISNCILAAQQANKPLNLNFVCTHNSRRSQFSQVWAYTLSHYFGMTELLTFSSGTESTSVYRSVIDSLSNHGFKTKKLVSSENPKYSIRISDELEPLILFSKTISEVRQSAKQFIAIMTCSAADESCPIVLGASNRFKMTFEDPKHSDGSIHEGNTYDSKSIEIAITLFHIFEQVSSKTRKK